MNTRHTSFFAMLACIAISLLVSCSNNKRPPQTVVAETPEQLDKKATDVIRESLTFASSNKGDIGDSIMLHNTSLVSTIYTSHEFNTIWAQQEHRNIAGDSLLNTIRNARLYGLFPEDYHLSQLEHIDRRFAADTLEKGDRRDAVLWAKQDMLLTDALIQLMHDVKLGRLPNDSVSLRKDSVMADSFLVAKSEVIRSGNSISALLASLEPTHEGYYALKAAIPDFLSRAAFDKAWTIVPSSRDSGNYKPKLQKRLFEGGYIAYDSVAADSATLAQAVSAFQKEQGITVDGKAGEGTLRMLNMNDRERFVRIAISMDRYRLLPPTMPTKYVWVNLPSYYMKVQEGDSVKLVSKIICGKTKTRTPLLTSNISEIITYPQWTVPNSIIIKEMLPAAKRDPGYFAKKGLSLVDKDGNEVDPYTVEWSKYSKGIPYKVVQGSGDANALGILKFNFPNKYAVYLHDTNQRYLFGQTMRSLSHGCVRVQEWQSLAKYLIANGKDDSPVLDSMDSWISRKEKHSIPLKVRVPVYIRYFTCEGKDGKVAFYDDIYGEDKALRDRYFTDK